MRTESQKKPHVIESQRWTESRRKPLDCKFMQWSVDSSSFSFTKVRNSRQHCENITDERDKLSMTLYMNLLEDVKPLCEKNCIQCSTNMKDTWNMQIEQLLSKWELEPQKLREDKKTARAGKAKGTSC